jgi:hypothetical protein
MTVYGLLIIASNLLMADMAPLGKKEENQSE